MLRLPLDFYLVPRTSELPPLRDEWLLSAEHELRVAFPGELVALLRLQNGGQLRYDSHAADIDGRDHVSIHNLRGIGPNGRDGLRHNRYCLDEWELPEGLILLDGNGHEWIALDYRDSSAEPSLCWVNADTGKTVKLASTFGEFLEGLQRSDHWVCFGFAQPISSVTSRLTTVLGIAFRESRLVPVSFEAEHSTWRDEFGAPAALHIESNDSGFASGFPEHPECSTILRADLLAEHRPALAAAMAALDLDAKLVHTPPWRQG